MKAVIMAGGMGTRLRPLTYDRPKPLVPLVGKSCILYILDLLKSNGITDVCVTLMYLGEKIKEELSSEQYDGMYQTLYEVELWDSLSWEKRLIFCPIIDYDSASCVSTMVYVEPLMDEATAKTISDEESLKVMTDILLRRGACLWEICLFIKILKEVCKETDLVEEDILNNLSNIGYNKELGIRVLDYGLSQKLLEEQNNV